MFHPRRRRRSRWNYWFDNAYLNLGAQSTTIIVMAILLAGLIFTGLLLFRYSDKYDLLSRGERQMTEGKVAWAARTFESMVSRYPDSFEGHVALGKAYLLLNERKKAAHEFYVASALQSQDGDPLDADIARSKLFITQRNFVEGEEQLLADVQQQPDHVRLAEALQELYEQWADYLQDHEQDYPHAIEKYESALNYVHDYDTEERLQGKIVATIRTYAKTLEKNHLSLDGIEILQRSLRHRYDTATLIRLAEIFERNGQLDHAIAWYRKAYDANPDIISIKLCNMLIRRGKDLTAHGKQAKAQILFDEADQVIRQSRLSANNLYPVTLASFRVEPNMDYEQGLMTPIIRVTLKNKSHRVQEYLALRVTLFHGKRELAQVVTMAASPENPLRLEPHKASARTLRIQPDEPIDVTRLQGALLRVVVAIAFEQGPEAKWDTKGLQDIRIRSGRPPRPRRKVAKPKPQPQSAIGPPAPSSPPAKKETSSVSPAPPASPAPRGL